MKKIIATIISLVVVVAFTFFIALYALYTNHVEVAGCSRRWEGAYIGEDGNIVLTNIFDFEDGKFARVAERIEKEARKAERDRSGIPCE